MRAFLMLATLISPAMAAELTVELGPVNGVLLESNEKRLCFYGWKETDAEDVDRVLLTHGRRDVVWKAQPNIEAGAKVVAPNRERYHFEKPDDFWKNYATSRFHDYGQQSTKILAAPVSVDQWVNDGDTIEWEGLSIQVVETPGFTRGSVSYVVDIDGKKTAMTGDLIYGDGQILDLYSFQDAIPEAQVRGYHGYGARLADLVTSLQKIRDLKPDRLIPARGPAIEKPAKAIKTLIDRVQSLYRNYLSTNALHWYFKEERMKTCGARVLGKGAKINLMPYSQHEKTPDWIYENGTSRLLISDTGNGFLLDCGNQRVIDAIKELIDQGAIKKVEGIFVTHYHDDHTDSVQDAATEFGCPVYATKEYADVLSNPEGYHLPAMTANAIADIQVLDDGHEMKWHEFQLTFQFFPGQTYYHGALFARKADERPVFFIGDAFAPSGLDDYCVQNRNLVHDDSGYLYCLNKLREIKEPFWLVNEHIKHVFAFSSDELDYLEKQYRARIDILRKLFPFDDPNYGIDEQWAVMYPRGKTVPALETFLLEVRIANHSPASRTFKIKVHLPKGMSSGAVGQPVDLELDSRQSGILQFPVSTSDNKGVHLITADITSDGMNFHRWIEAAITIE